MPKEATLWTLQDRSRVSAFGAPGTNDDAEFMIAATLY